MTSRDAHAQDDQVHGHGSAQDAPAQLCALSDDWSETFRLLGDPTRLRLLTLLHYEGPGTLSMSELADRAGVKTATASAALRLLTTAGIVTATRDGRMMRYALTDERVHRLLHHLGGTHAH
ncbi:ArsR/SmtB family transcription factor [Corynebacterium terpenotabidum]|uniref:ArsR DNA-binding transcription regulator n=1 Tax=Corynebacterium terpenotabidum Y-11 TaxID=1200352 RepID=S4XGX6_9CORY|nr:helix-turn-helix domain-containing protein [Corynebacterium terpenotabidum]AGP31839.1 ArsR DNA-binding transcription regulator [Corynebacterium terpenotabidum Y-11]